MYISEIIIHIQDRQFLGISDHSGSVIMSEDIAVSIPIVEPIRLGNRNRISDLRRFGCCFRILIVFIRSFGVFCCDLFPVDNAVGRFPFRVEYSISVKIQLSYIRFFTDIHAAVIRSCYKASVRFRYLRAIADDFLIAVAGQRTCPPPEEFITVAGCDRQRINCRAIVII